MRKIVLTVILIFTMLFSVCSFSAGAESAFSLDAELSYGTDSVSLDISGETPASYGQLISIVVYEIDSPENALAENPAVLYPLTNILKIVRLEDIAAEYDGDYEVSLPFDDVADSKYFVIQATGGGLASAGATASTLIYYEKQSTIDSVTLPRFKAVQEDGLEELLKSKQLLLGYYCDSNYEANKADIHSLFVSIRAEDYPDNFESITDVQTTLKAIDVLLPLRANPTALQMETLIKNNKEMFSFNFADTDYTENESEIYSTIEGFLENEDTLPDSMADVTTALRQATGIVIINDLDATKMTSVVEKYAGAFGIDAEDYAEACETYGENSVNMAFVERDFKNSAEVLSAYNDRIDTLKEEKEEEGKPSGGGGSGGGSGKTQHAEISNEIFAPVVPEKTDYRDIDNKHWAYEAISYLSEKEVLNGFADGSFSPDNAVTREQLVKIIVEAFGIEATSSSTGFSDVDAGRWSAKYISAAAGAGVVSGTGEGRFSPDSPVTRQDAAVMLKRVCEKYGITLSDDSRRFADKAEIASYAQESVNALSAAGIITGFEDGTFRPGQTLTRAQAAKMIYGLIK